MKRTIVRESTKRVEVSPPVKGKLLLPPESAGAKNQEVKAAADDPEDLQFERVKQEKVKIAQYYQKLLC